MISFFKRLFGYSDPQLCEHEYYTHKKEDIGHPLDGRGYTIDHLRCRHCDQPDISVNYS